MTTVQVTDRLFLLLCAETCMQRALEEMRKEAEKTTERLSAWLSVEKDKLNSREAHLRKREHSVERKMKDFRERCKQLFEID